MPHEIEIKFRLDDPDALRRRLRGLHAESEGDEEERNRIFDFPDHRLRNADSALRVRTVFEDDEPVSTTLTYKGPRQPTVPPRREQLELEVEDEETIATLLARIGLREQVHYEKRRETWLLPVRPSGGPNEMVAVLLDELPELGWFIEIEGPACEAVLEAVRRLGLDPSQALRESYVELAAREGRKDEHGVSALRFEQE